MYVHNMELTSSFLHWTTVYIRIRKGMYGLVQAATLAYKHLEKNLAHHSSFPCPSITGLWKHVSQQKTFCLCVDDLGINYFLKEDTDHLLISLHSNYRISVNWEGKKLLWFNTWLEVCQRLCWHFHAGLHWKSQIKTWSSASLLPTACTTSM